MSIGVIGLGKLGLPLAGLLALNNNSVQAYDYNLNLIQTLKAGVFSYSEPGLTNLLQRTRKKLIFTSSISQVVLESSTVFIIVPTPSLQNGFFSNEHILEVVKEIGKVLRNKEGKFVLSVVSTVMPGSTNGEIRSVLEVNSRKKIGLDLGLCYNPEFIALGSVIHDMQYPDMQLLGASSEWAADQVEAILKTISVKSVPIRRMNLEEAELVKISINNYVTMKIAFGNMLLQISEKFNSNVDVDVVTEALGLDSRIGSKYLKSGAPFGGPCFPRDTRALSAFANSLKIDSSIPEKVYESNKNHLIFLARKVLSETKENEIIGVLGISYKPFTDILDESPALSMSDLLMDNKRKVILWDPLIKSSYLLKNKIEIIDDIEELFTRSTYIVLARPLPELNFGNLNSEKISKIKYDIWRQLKK